MDFKRFRIPNRDVKLTREETEITSTETFQRLFYLKQLGLAYLVYPFATHTRAGHSIECLDEANNILKSIKIEKDHDDWAKVRIAALLHDIGHIPFSHTLEDENVVLPKHDKKERIEVVLQKIGNEVSSGTLDLIKEAKPILLAISSKDEKDHDWKSDLVGNTVCADLLAYITTDASWTGIEKRPGYYRIYDYFMKKHKTLDDGTNNERLCIQLTKGGLRTDIVSAILDLLDMRYALTERVLFHHAKAIASAMLARAGRLCSLQFNQKLLEIGDELFFDFLKKQASNCKDKTSGEGANLLINQLLSRKLYKRIFKIQRSTMEDWDRSKSKTNDDSFCSRWRNHEKIEDLLAGIENKFELPRGSLVLWCPEGRSGMKLVNANVVWERSGGWHDPVELRSKEVKQQFPGVHGRVVTIEEQYLDLWTFWIGIHPDLISEAPKLIDELSDRLEIECDPVFIETYAKNRLNGFAESSELHESIKRTWREDYVPKVSRRVYDIAALSGGEKEINDSIITEAIYDVSTLKRKEGEKIKKIKDKNQLGIFNKGNKEEKKL